MRSNAARAKRPERTSPVKAEWDKLLQEALTKPGSVNKAYHLYHHFSLSNSIWLLMQLAERGIEAGPAASYNHWRKVGRQVRKGEKAFWLYMPVLIGGGKRGKKADETKPGEGQTTFTGRPDANEGESRQKEARPQRIFIARPNWFVLAQTEPVEGAEPEPEHDAEQACAAEGIGFSTRRAAEALGITVVPFDEVDGNMQGYAKPTQKQIAISPVAVDPIKTSVHEMAHCLLHGDVAEFRDGLALDTGIREVEAEGTAYLVCATLGHTANLDTMRGYIQNWLAHSGQAFGPQNAKRIFMAANKILRAGEDKPDKEGDVA